LTTQSQNVVTARLPELTKDMLQPRSRKKSSISNPADRKLFYESVRSRQVDQKLQEDQKHRKRKIRRKKEKRVKATCQKSQMFYEAVPGGKQNRDRKKGSATSREVDQETENDQDREKDGEERVRDQGAFLLKYFQ